MVLTLRFRLLRPIPPHPRVLTTRFRHRHLTPPLQRRLRFQRLHLLTLTWHRLMVLRLTFHMLLPAPITPRRVMLRPPHLLVLRPQATWRRL